MGYPPSKREGCLRCCADNHEFVDRLYLALSLVRSFRVEK